MNSIEEKITEEDSHTKKSSSVSYSYLTKSEDSRISDTGENKTSLTPMAQTPKMDFINHRYPYCIVWTPLPLITAIIPCIGHTGICTSNGIIHDFAGSFYVSLDNMAFGHPVKYVLLNPSERERKEWDHAVQKGDDRYNNEEHNLCINNCHSHCAYVLNVMNYNNKSNYTMVHIWWMMCMKSRYVSWFAIFKTYIGFIIFIGIIFALNKFLK